MPIVEDGPSSGQRLSTSTPHLTVPPEIVEEANRDLDALDDLLGPPTERRSRALSQVAIRSDGALLVSLDDADEHITEGRVIQRYMVLDTNEIAFVSESAKEFLDDRAARVIGKLPRREP